jgi:hypothetical protein
VQTQVPGASSVLAGVRAEWHLATSVPTALCHLISTTPSGALAPFMRALNGTSMPLLLSPVLLQCATPLMDFVAAAAPYDSSGAGSVAVTIEPLQVPVPVARTWLSPSRDAGWYLCSAMCRW